ncbi:PTS sugar transporter subunit IIC [Companilactobacillus crustorum]|uniref:PTS mannose/fructose/sorbose/N-acetylgalactosamine transporter subunit IIC n=1 Tax=Companilactobacillus crustorum TaxID=392416 RepID=UPI00237E6436|nr:PTS sugar transporter subunit IIC [Companilactobacillus crustorum]WDT65715.1 PTS sugar transporter subunit IIC [Companilactobacillus crustorum]
MLYKAIILGIIGIIVVWDSRLFGRLNVEQPLIASTLVGIALGDVTKGLMVGATLELISLGLVNVGAAAPPDMALGSIIAAAFAILSGASAQTALTIAIPIAVLGQLLAIVLRMAISSFNVMANRYIDEGKFKSATNLHIIWGSALYAISYFVPIFISIYFGTGLVKQIVSVIPKWLTSGLTVASAVLPAYGFALLLSTMLSKKMAPYFFIGFLITAYANISVTGIALFAILIAILLDQIIYKDKSSSSSGGDGDSLDSL